MGYNENNNEMPVYICILFVSCIVFVLVGCAIFTSCNLLKIYRAECAIMIYISTIFQLSHINNFIGVVIINQDNDSLFESFIMIPCISMRVCMNQSEMKFFCS